MLYLGEDRRGHMRKSYAYGTWPEDFVYAVH